MKLRWWAECLRARVREKEEDEPVASVVSDDEYKNELLWEKIVIMMRLFITDNTITRIAPCLIPFFAPETPVVSYHF